MRPLAHAPTTRLPRRQGFGGCVSVLGPLPRSTACSVRQLKPSALASGPQRGAALEPAAAAAWGAPSLRACDGVLSTGPSCCSGARTPGLRPCACTSALRCGWRPAGRPARPWAPMQVRGADAGPRGLRDAPEGLSWPWKPRSLADLLCLRPPAGRPGAHDASRPAASPPQEVAPQAQVSGVAGGSCGELCDAAASFSRRAAANLTIMPVANHPIATHSHLAVAAGRRRGGAGAAPPRPPTRHPRLEQGHPHVRQHPQAAQPPHQAEVEGPRLPESRHRGPQGAAASWDTALFGVA